MITFLAFRNKKETSARGTYSPVNNWTKKLEGKHSKYCKRETRNSESTLEVRITFPQAHWGACYSLKESTIESENISIIRILIGCLCLYANGFSFMSLRGQGKKSDFFHKSQRTRSPEVEPVCGPHICNGALCTQNDTCKVKFKSIVT